jgi:hypothetical protein
MMMDTKFWLWLAWFVFLLLLDFILPFTIFRQVASFSGSFLFWVVWCLVAIISMFCMFSSWRENQSPESGSGS